MRYSCIDNDEFSQNESDLAIFIIVYKLIMYNDFCDGSYNNYIFSRVHATIFVYIPNIK